MSKADEIKEFLPVLNSISSSMCFAKWYHLNLYIHLGENHSCYHPSPHKIPLEEIEKSPAALHNSQFKKSQRQLMLEGSRPAECHYCWKIEDLNDGNLSDRMIKSCEQIGARPELLKKPKELGSSADFTPTVIEISFSNACNFKCVYCAPKASSSWQKEIEKFGPYPEIKNNYSINGITVYSEEKNPYLDAWKKWWPEIKSSLQGLRITGGEPLLHASTYEILDSLKNEPNPKLYLMVNSNLGVPHATVQKFTEKIRTIKESKSIEDFRLYTSMESWGKRAEFSRFGLDLNLWEKNFHAVLNDLPDSRLSFMCTFNNLCLTSFKSFLEKILEWRAFYCRKEKRIEMDISYLKEPSHFLVTILPKEFAFYFEECLEFMRSHHSDDDPSLFDSIEIGKMNRVFSYFKNYELKGQELTRARSDLLRFLEESNRRRGTDFESLFPEMKDFFVSIRNCASE